MDAVVVHLGQFRAAASTAHWLGGVLARAN
jgi:hypothetical protein